MSATDYQEYHGIAEAFIGRALGLGLPMNSLKLMVDASRHQESYIWIDPPWTLSNDGARIIGSDDYPDPDGPDYHADHESWGSVVLSALDEAVLQAVTIEPDGSTEFVFGNNVRLVVAVQGVSRDPESWYDDWYAKP